MASLRQFSPEEHPSVEIGFTRSQLEVLEKVLNVEYDKSRSAGSGQASALAHVLLEVEEGLDILAGWEEKTGTGSADN